VGTLIIIEEDVPVAVEFIETTAADDDGNSTASLAANWGDEVDGRLTIVAVHHAGGSLRTLVSATIGGVAASVLAPQAGQDTLGVLIIGALNVPGTSGTIDLTFSGSVGVRCGVWRAVNVESVTPIDTATTNWGFDSATHTVNLDVEESGAVFTALFAQADAPDFTAGITVEDYSEEIVPTSSLKIAAGFALTPATVLNEAVTAERGGASTWRGAMTAFSIR
jgi:hypothetical protein